MNRNHRNNNLYISLLLKVFILLWASQSFASVVSIQSLEKQEARLFINNSIIFSENYWQEFNGSTLISHSLFAVGELEHSIGDKKALGVVAKLLVDDNAKGTLALANYLQRYPKDFVAFQLAAIQLVERKQYAEAELALQEILNAAPNYTPAIMLMGISLYMHEQYSLGTTFLEKAIKNNDASSLAYRYLSWNFIRQNDYNQAKRVLEQSLRVHGIPTIEASIPHLELAEIYRLLADFEKITILFQPLMDNEKLDLSVQNNLEAISRYFEAAAFFNKVTAAKKAEAKLQKTPAYTSFPAVISRAHLLALDGKTKEAIALLNSMDTEIFASNQVRLLNVARVYALTQSKKEGMATLTEYIDNYDGNLTFKVLQNYIDVAVALGEGNKALAFLRELTTTNKDNLTLAYLLANTLLQSGDLTGAMDQVINIISKDSNFANAHYLKGVILYNRNKNNDAATAFRQAIESDPAHIDAWLALLGALHDHRKHSHSTSNASADHKEIIPLLKEAINKNPNASILRYELGLTLYSGGAIEEAQLAFDETLRLVPFDLSTLYMSSIVRADQNIELARATKLASIAAQLVPDNPIVQDSYGWALIRSGNLSEGMQLSQNALKEVPDDPAIQLHIGYGHYLLNNYALAKPYFMAALNGELPPHSALLIRDTMHQMEPISDKVVAVHTINGFGVGDKIGTIRLSDSAEGLRVEADISGLPPGYNGMHMHEKPSCDAGFEGAERIAGMAAGGHYGHHDHAAMLAENGQSSEYDGMPMKAKGDLPALETDKDGRSIATVIGKQLVLSELRGRSLMIHFGPDSNGVSGDKIACAIIN